MAKKQRQERTLPESSATVFGHQSLTVATAAPAGSGGTDSATAENLLGGLLGFYDSEISVSAFGQHDSSLYLSYNTYPLALNTTEFMHKPKTTQPEKDNIGQQPEATVADDLTVAPSTAFPHIWFEKPYFPASSNLSNFALSSFGIGGGTIHQMGAGGFEDGGRDGRVSPHSSSHAAESSSSWVKDRAESMSWRARNEATQSSPSTSSTSQKAPEVLSNKRRKKRPSGASVDIFSDSDDSDDDDDDDDCSLSDAEGDEGAVRRNSQQFAAKFLELRSSGKPCNFWQYNSQARGPKGRRIYGEITLKDCHVLDEFSDPVSHGESGIGQPNKLRHGEGNDPRPDTQKLMEIGSRISRLEEEFRGLSAVKSGLTKGDEVGRQKNKLASRICRLKKKAQHEANKVKLEGLREEHEQLVSVVARLVTIMETHILTTKETTMTTPVVSSQPPFCSQLESLIRSNLKFMIAGHTAEYVNMQLQKLAERLGPTGRTPS